MLSTDPSTFQVFYLPGTCPRLASKPCNDFASAPQIMTLGLKHIAFDGGCQHWTSALEKEAQGGSTRVQGLYAILIVTTHGGNQQITSCKTPRTHPYRTHPYTSPNPCSQKRREKRCCRFSLPHKVPQAAQRRQQPRVRRLGSGPGTPQHLARRKQEQRRRRKRRPPPLLLMCTCFGCLFWGRHFVKHNSHCCDSYISEIRSSRSCIAEYASHESPAPNDACPGIQAPTACVIQMGKFGEHTSS